MILEDELINRLYCNNNDPYLCFMSCLHHLIDSNRIALYCHCTYKTKLKVHHANCTGVKKRKSEHIRNKHHQKRCIQSRGIHTKTIERHTLFSSVNRISLSQDFSGVQILTVMYFFFYHLTGSKYRIIQVPVHAAQSIKHLKIY